MCELFVYFALVALIVLAIIHPLLAVFGAAAIYALFQRWLAWHAPEIKAMREKEEAEKKAEAKAERAEWQSMPTCYKFTGPDPFPNAHPTSYVAKIRKEHAAEYAESLRKYWKSQGQKNLKVTVDPSTGVAHYAEAPIAARNHKSDTSLGADGNPS